LLRSANDLDEMTEKLLAEQNEGKDLTDAQIVQNKIDMDYEIAKYINYVDGPTNTEA